MLSSYDSTDANAKTPGRRGPPIGTHGPAVWGTQVASVLWKGGGWVGRSRYPFPNEGYPRAWDMSVPLSGGNRAHLACEERVARNSCSVCQVALSPCGPPPQDLGGVWLWKRVGIRPPSPGPAGRWQGVAPAPPFEFSLALV